MYVEQLDVIVFTQFTCKLTEVRPLFTLSHIRSDYYPLLIVFSAKYIDQSIVTLNDFVIFKNAALRLKYAIWLVKIMTQYATIKLMQSSLQHDQ